MMPPPPPPYLHAAEPGRAARRVCSPGEHRLRVCIGDVAEKEQLHAQAGARCGAASQRDHSEESEKAPPEARGRHGAGAWAGPSARPSRSVSV